MPRLGLFCALLFTLCGCEDRGEGLLQKGNTLASKGKLDEAAKAYEEAKAALPTDSRPLELLGNVKLEQRDATAARAAFEQALALNPSAVRAHIGLGRLDGEAGKLDAALTHLSQAVDRAQDQPDAHIWRAVYLAARGAPADLELALKDVDSVLASTSTEPSALYVRGNVLIAQKNVAEAKKTFEQLPSSSPLFHYGLARLAAAQGDRLGALAELREAREKSKDDPRALPLAEVRSDPAFKFLENDPDFIQLVPR